MNASVNEVPRNSVHTTKTDQLMKQIWMRDAEVAIVDDEARHAVAALR